MQVCDTLYACKCGHAPVWQHSNSKYGAHLMAVQHVDKLTDLLQSKQQLSWVKSTAEHVQLHFTTARQPLSKSRTP